MDRWCSGRQACDVAVVSLVTVTQPCPLEFSSYLEASFTCVPGKYFWLLLIHICIKKNSNLNNVIYIDKIWVYNWYFNRNSLAIYGNLMNKISIPVFDPGIQCCHVPGGRVLVNAGSGYLASIVTEESGCGTTDCPWHIQTQHGEKIKLYLLDFGYRKKLRLMIVLCNKCGIKHHLSQYITSFGHNWGYSTQLFMTDAIPSKNRQQSSSRMTK